MVYLKAMSVVAGCVAVAVSLGVAVGAAERGPLEGTWQLARTGDRTVEGSADQLPFFTITGGKITGFDGCNRFGGPLEDPQRIVRGQRGCGKGHVELPLDLGNPAGHLKAGTILGDRLLLPAHGALPESEFRRR